MPMCPRCQSCETTWKEASGQAVVYSYTVVHHAAHPAASARLPYVVGVLEFEGMPGVRLVSNVTDIDPKQVRIGATVRLWWDDIGEGMFVPRFRP